MDKMFSPVGFHDFFSHFVPGLLFITAMGLLHNFNEFVSDLKGETIIMGIIAVIIFMLSYVSGRIFKIVFELIMNCFFCRDLFYHVNDKDKNDKDNKEKDKKKDTSKGVFTDNIDSIAGTDYRYYDCNEDKPYRKKLIIEQAATILIQKKINGDFIIYHQLKYYYQLMSTVSFLIFVLYLFKLYLFNYPLKELFVQLKDIFLTKQSGGIMVLVAAGVLELYLYIRNKELYLKLGPYFEITYISGGVLFILVTLLITDYTLSLLQSILLFSLLCSFLFRGMFIFTYQRYLEDVIKNYRVYKAVS